MISSTKRTTLPLSSRSSRSKSWTIVLASTLIGSSRLTSSATQKTRTTTRSDCFRRRSTYVYLISKRQVDPVIEVSRLRRSRSYAAAWKKIWSAAGSRKDEATASALKVRISSRHARADIAVYPRTLQNFKQLVLPYVQLSILRWPLLHAERSGINCAIN